MRKFSRVVDSTKPPRIASLGANATACTTMSSASHFLLERREAGVDAVVAGDVHLEHRARAELRGHRLDAILEALLIAEGQLGAFTAHGLSDAVRNRALGREADDQGAFAGEKSHGLLRKWTGAASVADDGVDGPVLRGDDRRALRSASDARALIRDVHDQALARLDDAARAQVVPAEQIATAGRGTCSRSATACRPGARRRSSSESRRLRHPPRRASWFRGSSAPGRRRACRRSRGRCWSRGSPCSRRATRAMLHSVSPRRTTCLSDAVARRRVRSPPCSRRHSCAMPRRCRSDQQILPGMNQRAANLVRGLDRRDRHAVLVGDAAQRVALAHVVIDDAYALLGRQRGDSFGEARLAIDRHQQVMRAVRIGDPVIERRIQREHFFRRQLGELGGDVQVDLPGDVDLREVRLIRQSARTPGRARPGRATMRRIASSFGTYARVSRGSFRLKKSVGLPAARFLLDCAGDGRFAAVVRGDCQQPVAVEFLGEELQIVQCRGRRCDARRDDRRSTSSASGRSGGRCRE